MGVTAEQVALSLASIGPGENVVARCDELVRTWTQSDAGPETVAPILRYMETHPDVDLGSPGPLVHFVERFKGAGYEEQLVESVHRKPVSQTVWMLNRLINGADMQEATARLIAEMERVAAHPLADNGARETARGFLRRVRK